MKYRVLKISLFIAALSALVCIGGANASAADAPAAKPAKPAAGHSSGKSAKKPVARAAKPAPPASPKLVWALRDFYSFTLNGAKVYYAVDDADWALEFADLGMLVNHAGFQVTFGDGAILTAEDLGKGTSFREPFTDELGSGTQYGIEFPAKNGIVVRHFARSYTNCPFVVFHMELGNTGTTPIEIAKITPIFITPENVSNLGSEVDVSRRHLVMRGAYPVYDKDAAPLAVLLNDRAHKHTLALGSLPQGVASSSVLFEPAGASWRVDSTSAYSPGIQLAPGEKLAADPVWFSFTVPEPSRVDTFYSWAQSVQPRPRGSKDLPECWITVDEAADADKLLEAARQWGQGPVGHVLVPAHWEGRPGSLQGASGRYPKDMGKVARDLAGMGKVPGITLDPLTTDDGSKDWTAKSEDGQTWFNLARPEGKAAAVERIKKAFALGFKFLAVSPSLIPDSVLKGFNMTRPQSDFLAFDAAVTAADGLPVVATPATTLGANLDQWLEIAGNSSRMKEYGLVSGPLRIDVSSLTAIDDGLRAAMTLFGGPIELYGIPSGDAVRQLGTVFPRPQISGRPLDLARPTPKLWQVHVVGAEDGYRGDAILMFPGAAAWTLDDVDREPNQTLKVWRAENGQFVDPATGKLTGADRLTTYGLAPDGNRPALMGASAGIALLLDDVDGVSWDEASGILKGQFNGNGRAAGYVYIYVPESWTLKSGSFGGAKLKQKPEGMVLAIPVDSGSTAHFELAFLRK